MIPSLYKSTLFLFTILSFSHAFSQDEKVLEGKILDSNTGRALELVTVGIKGTSKGVGTSATGYFKLPYSNTNDTLKTSFIGYWPKELPIDSLLQLKKVIIYMTPKTEQLVEVNIEGKSRDKREEVSTVNIDPKAVKELPSAFGDFNKILTTLPGVNAASELSSEYSVRGGNYDENLIYVNDMLIYKPQLIQAGQQEGLSFVNPDLVEKVKFSSGGWQPRFGDKLSSVLEVEYKEPERFGGSFSAGLLGGTAHLEAANKENNAGFLIGFRHKRAGYLLNTLDVDGEYLPRFSDVQFSAYKKWQNKENPEKEWKLTFLGGYARNRYLLRPSNRETTFGTVNNTIRFFVAFDGQDNLSYDTYQSGLRLTRKFNDNFKTSFIASYTRSEEREYFDVESGYRLCDVNTNFGSEDFNECVATRGIGAFYTYGRNKLVANLAGLANRSYWYINKKHQIEFGAYSRYENIDDNLREYEFEDSADYVTVTEFLDSENELNSLRVDTYVQHRYKLDSNNTLVYGGRLSYWTLNEQLVFSPRVQYSHAFNEDLRLNAAAGIYRQLPFYRELRDPAGEVNRNVQAQNSIHVISGLHYNLSIWNRPFVLTSEAYYKYMWDVNPYYLEDVRIRYFANNNATAYATGVDFRIAGEFIKGTESWFSLGLMTTREDIAEDDRGYIPRPTDQRVNMAVLFQDHLPNNPTVRMYLKLLYSSGLPFGPPDQLQFRNELRAPAYRRVDIGFSKLVVLNERKVNKNAVFESVWISLEILNLIGARNVISYTWVEDFGANRFAVPNTLSQRFFNLRTLFRF